MRVRIRGIYATALTDLLGEEFEVVQASDPIRERFDAEFDHREHDAGVDTTADRQGVGVTGDPEAVGDLRTHLAGVGLDTFVWPDPAPDGSVFNAVVAETLGSGAVVDLGQREGFLPYDRTAEYVDTGDRMRVQVTEGTPPWSDDRPEVDTGIRVDGGFAGLVRGGGPTEVGSPDEGTRRELAGLTDLLSVDPPDGWRIRWERPAEDADLAALEGALERLRDRAEELEAAMASAPAPGEDAPRRIGGHAAGAWAWFGRDSRFALDGHRREVTRTMHGHHRIKAGGDPASAAVDFVEAICDRSGDGFPFDVVTRQFGPVEGDRVAIGHGKPDGRRVVLGEGEVTDRDPDGRITVRREMSPGGTYDALGVQRRDGDVAITKFTEGRWWYPTAYRGANGDRRGTYVNVCTPVEIFPTEVRYVDLHVDVVKHADGEVERVDDDELEAAVERGTVSEALADEARGVASSIEDAL